MFFWQSFGSQWVYFYSSMTMISWTSSQTYQIQRGSSPCCFKWERYHNTLFSVSQKLCIWVKWHMDLIRIVLRNSNISVWLWWLKDLWSKGQNCTKINIPILWPVTQHAQEPLMLCWDNKNSTKAKCGLVLCTLIFLFFFFFCKHRNIKIWCLSPVVWLL